MRIAVVHPSDELYGADRVLLEATAILARIGVVRVLLPTDVDYPDHALARELARRGIRCEAVPLPILRRSYLRAGSLPAVAARAWRTAWILRRLRPDVVYLSTSAALLVAPLARLTGAVTVAHIHESWSRVERLLLGPLLRTCSAVIAVSDAIAAGLPARRVLVVHNGIEPAEPDPGAVTAARESLGLPADACVVLMASRWNTWKGHDLLLAAWERVGRPDLHLVVLGGPPPSGASVDVTALVASLSDPSTVHVVGPRDDVPVWIRAADVVVVPSTRPDPLPTIAIEAAALGRAVLAADSGGLPEIVDDGVTGMLVPTGDADAWAQALRSVSVEGCAAQGERARLRYLERFTREAFDERFSAALAAHGLEARPDDTARSAPEMEAT